MDESLFIKHALQIRKQKNSKDEIITYIKEKTGIELHEEMFSILKKQVTFSTSSVTKQRLFQKNIIKILEEKGYTSKF